MSVSGSFHFGSINTVDTILGSHTTCPDFSRSSDSSGGIVSFELTSRGLCFSFILSVRKDLWPNLFFRFAFGESGVHRLEAMAVELIEGYRYVLCVLIFNIIVNQTMAFMVGRARKRYNVWYPTMYASESEHKDAKAFNCVQRAHQNTLEFAPSMMMVLLIGGLQYPLVAAVLGGLYGLARIQFFRGYASGDARKRFSGGGVIIFPCYFGLIICSICFTLHQFFPNLV